MIRDKGNFIAAACLAGFGIYVISVATRLAYVSEVGPGPGFFPLWLGIGMVLFASVLMFTSLSQAAVKAKAGASWHGSRRALAGWAALIVAVALLGTLGFALSFVVLTVFLIVALDRRPALLAMAVAIGLAVAFQLIFVLALDVELPKGILGF